MKLAVDEGGEIVCGEGKDPPLNIPSPHSEVRVFIHVARSLCALTAVKGQNVEKTPVIELKCKYQNGAVPLYDKSWVFFWGGGGGLQCIILKIFQKSDAQAHLLSTNNNISLTEFILSLAQ